MQEVLPIKYPDVLAFVDASSVLNQIQIEYLCNQEHISVEPHETDTIIGLMTPPAILEQQEHSRKIIDPADFPTFDALLKHRMEISNLQLVPKRADEVQREYERMDGTLFLRIVRDHYLNGTQLAVVNELYPTNLPQDIIQHVVWTAHDNISNHDIARVIAQITRLSGLTIDDIILFERSRVSKADFVRVAVPQHRHIHLWMRKKKV